MSDYRCLRPVPSKNFPREFTRCLKKESEHGGFAPGGKQSSLGGYPDDGLIHDHPFQRSSIFELQRRMTR